MEGTIKFNKRHVPGRWRGRIRLPRGGGGVTARSRRSGDIWLEPRGCVGGEDGEEAVRGVSEEGRRMVAALSAVHAHGEDQKGTVAPPCRTPQWEVATCGHSPGPG